MPKTVPGEVWTGDKVSEFVDSYFKEAFETSDFTDDSLVKDLLAGLD